VPITIFSDDLNIMQQIDCNYPFCTYLSCDLLEVFQPGVTTEVERRQRGAVDDADHTRRQQHDDSNQRQHVDFNVVPTRYAVKAVDDAVLSQARLTNAPTGLNCCRILVLEFNDDSENTTLYCKSATNQPIKSNNNCNINF